MRVRHTAAGAVILAISFAFCSNAWASVACPTDTVEASDDQAFERVQGLVCDLNVVRSQNGLRPLRWSWYLWAAAQRMADDVRTRHYFSHVTPDGRNLADRVGDTGYIPDNPTWTLGENLGWGSGALSSPISIVTGWMNSPGHRANVLDPTYEDIGIGVAQGSPMPQNRSGMVFVADFGSQGTPVASASTSPPAPASARSTSTRARTHGRGWVRTRWSRFRARKFQ